MDFDAYAGDYEDALARGLSLAGEGSVYFIRGRLAWLAQCLDRQGMRVASVMDFGCGVGASAPLLGALLGAQTVIGVDESPRLLEVARRASASAQVRFLLRCEYQPNADLDLAYCNGVFHHIPVAERPGAVAYVRDALRPGGLLSLWENNPWNPGARWVMRRIPFDRDAVPLRPSEARRLLVAGGFDVLDTDFHFVFPHLLRAFRPLEGRLVRWPLGAQYQVLARKP
jgi:SAM-dependent methyltransferase